MIVQEPLAGSRHVEGHLLEVTIGGSDRLALIDITLIVDGTTEQPARLTGVGRWTTTTVRPATRTQNAHRESASRKFRRIGRRH